MSTRATLGLFLLAIAACPSTPAAEEPPYSVASEIEQACPQCSDCDCEECFKCPLLGFIQPTDTTWANFISPMTNPVFLKTLGPYPKCDSSLPTITFPPWRVGRSRPVIFRFLRRNSASRCRTIFRSSERKMAT